MSTWKQASILRYLLRCEARGEGAMTVSEIAETVGRSPSAVRDMLITLCADIKVERVGHAGNSRTYGLTDRGRDEAGTIA